MSSPNQDMLDACSSGDVAALQRLFEVREVQKGSKPVYIPTPGSPLCIDDLLTAAIINENVEIIILLLETYNDIQFSGGVIYALLEHPSMAILEALYKYDNNIVNFEWDSNFKTFVVEACTKPPEKITPLIHFLVEHDAALDTGGLPCSFAVQTALCGGQQLDVIEAMIKKGGPVTFFAAQQAILRERIDVIESFIRFGVTLQYDRVQDLRAEAVETGNTDVVKLVDKWISSWKDDTSKEITVRRPYTN